jgi:hypothetical protein
LERLVCNYYDADIIHVFIGVLPSFGMSFYERVVLLRIYWWILDMGCFEGEVFGVEERCFVCLFIIYCIELW